MTSAKNYIWGIVGKIGPQAINLLVTMILARYLTPAEFGKIGVLAVFLVVAFTFTDSGLGGSIVKEKTISKEDCETVFTFNLGISLLCYLIIFVCAELIERFYNVEGLATVTRWLSLVFVLSALSIVPKSLMIRDLKFKQLTLVTILSYMMAGIIAIIGCYANWGVYTLVVFQLSIVGFNSILINMIARYRIRIGFSRNSFKKLFSFGAFTTLCNIIDSIYDNILSILFGKFTGVRFVGFYEQAKKIETGSSNSIVTTINTVAFPILTKLRDDKKLFLTESNSLFKSIQYAVSPLLFVIIIYSREIITVLFGEKWLESANILEPLMINGIFLICESLVRNNLKSLGEVKLLAEITLVKRILGVGIILSFLLISGFSMLYGLILSTFIGFIVNTWFFCCKIGVSLWDQLWVYVKSFLVPAVVVVTLIVGHILIPTVLLRISWGVVCLVVYYALIIPILKRESKSQSIGQL